MQAAKLFNWNRTVTTEPVQHELIIEPGQGMAHYWRDLWRYRELFLFLAWRDIVVRYKQTVIGVAWAIVRPVLTMVVFTVVFGRLAGLSSDGAPYPILVYAAMLPWQFFANALSESSNSLISNAQMITKIYFPRLAIPLAAVMVSFVDFLISFVILVVLMGWYQFWPTSRLWMLPLLIAQAGLTHFYNQNGWRRLADALTQPASLVSAYLTGRGLFSPSGVKALVHPDLWQEASKQFDPIAHVAERAAERQSKIVNRPLPGFPVLNCAPTPITNCCATRT